MGVDEFWIVDVENGRKLKQLTNDKGFVIGREFLTQFFSDKKQDALYCSTQQLFIDISESSNLRQQVNLRQVNTSSNSIRI